MKSAENLYLNYTCVCFLRKIPTDKPIWSIIYKYTRPIWYGNNYLIASNRWNKQKQFNLSLKFTRTEVESITMSKHMLVFLIGIFVYRKCITSCILWRYLVHYYCQTAAITCIGKTKRISCFVVEINYYNVQSECFNDLCIICVLCANSKWWVKLKLQLQCSLSRGKMLDIHYVLFCCVPVPAVESVCVMHVA